MTPDFIQAIVQEYMAGPANSVAMPGGPEAAYETPLVGFAAGNDPIWDEIAAKATPGQWRPLEAFGLAFPGEAASADELSVIVWILPQTETTLRDQREALQYPCERWVRNYKAKERVVNGLASHVVEQLTARGVQAVAPDLLPEFAWVREEKFIVSSRWSHRHAAFAAGLGTFGLSDALITARGKALRCGSVVARISLPPTPRPYQGYHDYCLYYKSGACGKCAKRCPAGAISKDGGHDKKKCEGYMKSVVSPKIAELYPEIAKIDACGLCQSGVPCERGIPGKD